VFAGEVEAPIVVEVAAAGHGAQGEDGGRGDVVRAARDRLGVVDADRGGHPLALDFSPSDQPDSYPALPDSYPALPDSYPALPDSYPALPGGGFGGGRAQHFEPHRDPFGGRRR
jgi:hypothetical protein